MTQPVYSYLTSRSHIEELDSCQRRGWLGHEYLDLGLELGRTNLPMSIGKHTHKGVELLMIVKGRNGNDHVAIETGTDDKPVALAGPVEDVAVQLALLEYDEEVKERNFEPDELGESPGEESVKFVYEESRAMIEALIRVFSRVALPQLLERYEVLEVEHDAIVPLTQRKPHSWDGGECVVCAKTADNPPPFCDGIGFRFIPDALLREKATGDLYVFSLKTAKEWTVRNEEAAKYDQQGVSEVWGTQTRLQLLGKGIQMIAKDPANQELANIKNRIARQMLSEQKVMGVQMIYLLKGRTIKAKLDDNIAPEGTYYHQTPLLHPYRQMGMMPEDDRFADSVYWECLEPHDASYSYVNNKGKTVNVSKQCEGGARHKRRGDWVRCNVWKLNYGVSGWINRLSQPGGVGEDLDYALEKACIMPEPYYRSERDIEDWFEQTRAKVIEGARKAKETNDVLEQCGPKSEELRHLLNLNYPQDRSRCVWGGKCQFIAVCHEGVSDPLGSGVYQLRKGKDMEEVEVL